MLPYILSAPERRVRQHKDATGAPFSGRNEGGAQPPSAPILAEGGKSREREGRALAVRELRFLRTLAPF
jgi:hypothetical protein